MKKVTYGQKKYDKCVLSILIKLIVRRILLPIESRRIRKILNVILFRLNFC